MGIIFSKLSSYINSKVNSCKEAVRRRIDNTKQGIRNKVDNTKNAINNKVNQVITSVKNCIRSTKEDIIGAVVGVKDSICGRIRRTKDCICNFCLNVKNGVLGKIRSARNSVISAKNRVVNSVCAGRDCVVRNYENTRNSIHCKYRRIRDAKLTRWQKARCTVLGVVALCVLYVIVATSINLYNNDYEHVEQRFSNIWEGTKVTSQFLFDVSSTVATHAWQATCYSSRHLWYFSKMAGTHVYETLCLVKHHLHEGSKEAVTFVIWSFRETATVLWCWIKFAGRHVAIGVAVSADHAWRGSIVAAEHAKEAAVVCLHHASEGSKVAFHYAREGSLYAYHHSSIALRECSSQAFEFLLYFATDFRRASYEVAVWTAQFGKSAVCWTFSTSCQIVLLSCEFLVNAAAFSYYSTLDLMAWTYEQSFVVADDLATLSAYLASSCCKLSVDAYNRLQDVLISSYDCAVNAAANAYEKSISAYDSLTNWAAVVTDFVLSTSVYLYDILYVFTTEHLLVWLSKFLVLVLKLVSILLHILCKFFGDLGGFIYKFVSVTLDRAYTIIYFAISIAYTTVTFVLAAVRLLLSGLVFCMKGLFGAVIWFFSSLGKSYIYFLACYNNYREVTFFAFIGILSVYCASVARDRNESYKQLLRESVRTSQRFERKGLTEVEEDAEPLTVKLD